MTWFSPSQISTFLRCMRKWGWSRIGGIRFPSKAFQVLGTEVHAQQELWLSYGVPLDLTHISGEIAFPGLHYLAQAGATPRRPGMRVEEWFYLRWGDVGFRGIKDVQILDRVPPIVIDHKTTANVSYAKTPEELLDDPQACLYAADAMIETGSDSCELMWLYYQTRGARKAHPVRLTVTREQIEPCLRRCVDAAQEMEAILELGAKPLEIPGNLEACGDYGGCEYADLCDLSIGERYRAMAEESEFLQKMRAKKAAMAGGPPPPPTGAPVNPPSPPPAPPSAAPVLSPDGQHQLVNGAWIPYTPAPPPPPPPTAAPKAKDAPRPKAKSHADLFRRMSELFAAAAAEMEE